MSPDLVHSLDASFLRNLNMTNLNTFIVGQKLTFNSRRNCSAPVGATAVVGPKGYYTVPWGTEFIDIIWTDRRLHGGHTQADGGYYDFDFKSAVSVAKEPTAPMQRAVLDLLRRKGAITSMEAQGVLRCRQLPARVLELKRLGHEIVTEMKLDHTGQKYARYHLQAAA